MIQWRLTKKYCVNQTFHIFNENKTICYHLQQYVSIKTHCRRNKAEKFGPGTFSPWKVSLTGSRSSSRKEKTVWGKCSNVQIMLLYFHFNDHRHTFFLIQIQNTGESWSPSSWSASFASSPGVSGEFTWGVRCFPWTKIEQITWAVKRQPWIFLGAWEKSLQCFALQVHGDRLLLCPRSIRLAGDRRQPNLPGHLAQPVLLHHWYSTGVIRHNGFENGISRNYYYDTMSLIW